MTTFNNRYRWLGRNYQAATARAGEPRVGKSGDLPVQVMLILRA
jgi:hypothetical protein